MHAFAEDNRAFGYAVAASLAFHALVLFLRMPPVRESLAPPEPAAAPIEARLVEPPAAPPKVEAPPAPPLPAKKSEPPKPRPKLARPAPEPAPQAEPLPAPPSTAAVAEEALAPAAPQAPVMAQEERPGAAAAAATVQIPDTGSLAQFRQQLIGVAVRYKRYPRVALDNAWEGDVVVRVEIGASGSVAAVSVRSSSGHEVLDAQALDMFKKAAPQVPVPTALRGKDFSVDVRAIYSLKDQPSG